MWVYWSITLHHAIYSLQDAILYSAVLCTCYKILDKVSRSVCRKVNKALKDQVDKLWHTTNIYMHPTIHEYGQKLASKLPGKLKVSELLASVCECVCAFVCVSVCVMYMHRYTCVCVCVCANAGDLLH